MLVLRLNSAQTLRDHMVGSSVLQFFKLQSPEWTILEEFITVTNP